MAKKKMNTNALDAIDNISVETVQPEQTSEEILEEVASVDNTAPKLEPPPTMRPVTKVVAPSAPTPEPVQTVPVKKKRIRIRKKGAKKLSAAIICQNPNIVRFI